MYVHFAPHEESRSSFGVSASFWRDNYATASESDVSAWLNGPGALAYKGFSWNSWSEHDSSKVTPILGIYSLLAKLSHKARMDRILTEAQEKGFFDWRASHPSHHGGDIRVHRDGTVEQAHYHWDRGQERIVFHPREGIKNRKNMYTDGTKRTAFALRIGDGDLHDDAQSARAPIYLSTFNDGDVLNSLLRLLFDIE